VTDLKQAQTHFVELMAELFQLDEAQALDFGIYRVIRHRNNAVRAFLGEVQTKGDDKALVGGELQKILDTAFASKDEERSAELDARLSELEANFGLSAHLTADQRDQKLTELHAIPAMRGSVDEYRTLREQRDAARHGDDDRLEVLNRLHQFFDRHYQDGDFIVQRRYGREGQRYIRSTGQDTEFRWATEDMYYIKSGDIFTDFPVRLANGAQIVFAVDADTLNATRAALKPNDKAHYQLKSAKKDGDAVRVLLEYAKGARTKAHDKAIVDAIVGKTGAQAEDAARWLRRYIARNQSDFFIHKRLGEALNEELDIFLKTDVLDADQLLAGHARAQRHTRVAQQVRAIGREIIAFLAALEDFQKQLWEKKKLVLETRYIITLDRIEQLAGREWLEERLPAIIKAQRKEWKALGLGDYAKPKDCRSDRAYLPLPVDTGRLPQDFKWDFVSAVENLHQGLDGILLNSDNFTALRTVASSFDGRVKAVYIDPPYNTGTDGFPYKDSYPHSSWLAMMDDRIELGRRMLTRNGALFVSIDEVEHGALRAQLGRRFGPDNVIADLVWAAGRKNDSKLISVSHEYMIAAVRDKKYLADGGVEWRQRKKGLEEIYGRYEQLKSEHGSDYATITKALKAWYKSLPDGHPSKAHRHYSHVDKRGIYFPADISWPGGGGPTYRVLHPKTKKAVKVPARGWMTADEAKMQEWINDELVHFGPDESKVPCIKAYLKDREYQALYSVFYQDGRAATKRLRHVLGDDRFDHPKDERVLAEIFGAITVEGDWITDYFAGSGTTAHAVLDLNQQTGQRRKVLLAEIEKYFEGVLVERLKKRLFTSEWKDGLALCAADSGGGFMVQRIEQYEDTLENLALTPEQGESAKLPFDDGPTALRWKLDEEARRVYCAIEHYRSPFGYTLRRAEGAGTAEKVPVDLVESLVWLLGLDVARMWREPQGVAITGKNRRDESVLVAFRECDVKGSGDWVMRLMAEHPADRVYSNDPADLAFPGADRLEAIEAVFASQFGAA
jgi:Adenine specific DNA methylase Mod